MEEYTLDFKGANGYPSQCHITLFRQSGIVIATDIDKGMSVTNACEIIANEVVRQYDMNPQTLRFIERYRPGRADQTTDLVRFDFVDGKDGPTGRFRYPRWSHIPADKFEEIITKAMELEGRSLD